ncbi:homeobox protein PKNOX1-like [Argonauta hians]
MDSDERSAIQALLSLQYQIPCQVTKIEAEPSVDPLTTYSTYNNHHHHHQQHHHQQHHHQQHHHQQHHHQQHHHHHHHHHVNLPIKSVNSIKDENLLLPNQICSPNPISPPFTCQVKPFAKLSPLKPVNEAPKNNSVPSSCIVPSTRSTTPVPPQPPTAEPVVAAITPVTVPAAPSPVRERNVISCEDRCKRRRRGNLPKEAVRVMTDWLKSNRYNAYPSEDDKLKMATSLNIKHKQVSNWFINARRRKLTQILHKEGKDSKDFRITRKKKDAGLDESRATGSETEVSPTNLSTSSYPSPSSSSASDGSLGANAMSSMKQKRRSNGAGGRHIRQKQQQISSAMPPTPSSLTSFESNTSTEEDDDYDGGEGDVAGKRVKMAGGRDFVTFQQKNLEADVRTLHLENI